MPSSCPTSPVNSHTLDPVIYAEMRRLADRYLRHERRDHTLQTTALVHEAYLRLAGRDASYVQAHDEFLAAAATSMRRILINHAVRRHRAKRGGHWARIPLEDTVELFEEKSNDLVALDEALTRLATLDARQSRIVELRFFGGLTVEETARVLGTSLTTVEREWRIARAWLRREVTRL